jgi:hypothetical protein
MSKKIAPKARTTRRRSAKAPIFTNPHLTALLTYIARSGEDGDGRAAAQFERCMASAHTLFASYPLTSAFALFRDRPSIYDEVSANVRAEIQHWTDPKDSLRAFTAVDDARRDDSDSDTVAANDINEVADSYIEQGVLLGACLMYQMLKGGAR